MEDEITQDLNVVDNQASKDTKIISMDDKDNSLQSSVPGDNTEVDTPDTTGASDTTTEDTIDEKPVKKWANIASKLNAGELTQGEKGLPEIRDNIIDADLSSYREYLGPDIFVPEGSGVEILNRQRAEAQSWYEQGANFLGQAVAGEIVGGTIEGLGYMLDLGSVVDLLSGEEVEWGNFMTEFGQSIREGTEEKLRIYQDPTATGWGKMADSGWWFSNAVSVASTLSMLVPTTGAMRAASFIGKGIGPSKSFRAIRKAMGFAEEMGVKGKWMRDGISQAALSRNIENWMEAHGTFEDQKESMMSQINPKTGKKFTEEEATRFASEAAADNWKQGWAMLLQDIPQYLAIGKVFNPITRKMENALDVASKKGVTANLKPWQQKIVASGKTFVGEGAEESYQFLISENAKLKADLDAGLITNKEYQDKLREAIGSEEMLTSAFFGGLGGNVFQGAGKMLNKLTTSKSQKEFQESIGQYYSKMVEDNAGQVALMMNHLAQVDQMGNGKLRGHVINESMLNMVGNALETNKFSEFTEAIRNIGNMSQEDVDALNKAYDSQDAFNPELAKEYIPQILKSAERMRDLYLGFRNKNHNPTISNRLARLTLENERFQTMADNHAKDVADLQNQAPRLTELKNWNKLKLEEDAEVLRVRNNMLKERLNNEKNETKKNFIQSVLDVNEQAIKENNKAQEDLKKDKTPKSRTLSSSVESATKKKYDAIRSDIIESRLLEEEANDRILENTEDMSYSKTPEAKQKAEEVKYERMLEGSENLEDLEALSKEASESKILDDSQKEALKNKVDDRIKAVKAEKKKAEDKARQQKIEDDKRAKAQAVAKNPKVSDNAGVVADVTESVEDPDAGEHIDFAEQMQDKQSEVFELQVGDGKSVPMLDEVGDQKGLYLDWLANGKEKIGVKVTYGVANSGQWKSPRNNNKGTNKQQYKAWKDFNDGNINQGVYDYLNVQANFGEGTSIHTWLPTKPSDNADAIMHERYESNYAEQRRIIIDALAAGQTPTTEVIHSSGGQLQTQMDEQGVVAENNILDLRQHKNKSPRIIYTNVKGELYEMDRKNRAKGFEDTVFDVGEDEDGNKLPYRGGLFMVINKADGTPFPVRLNFLRNTQEQAEALAELLVGITVPEKKGKKQPKKFKMSDTVKSLDKDTQSRIKEALGPEIDFFKGKNPSLNDLINMFVYVSKNTEGLTSGLYMSGNRLYFGNEGKYIGPKGDNGATIEELVSFLTDVKRRQLNIKMWNNTKKYPGYRKFMMENKIINTNVIVGEPEFAKGEYIDKSGNKKTRRTKVYLAPLSNKKAPVPKEETVVQPTNDLSPENVITEVTGPSEVEINEAIGKKFPGKMYNYGINFYDDGTATTKIGDKPIPINDLQAIEKLKADMQAEFDAKNKPAQPTEQTSNVDSISERVSKLNFSERINALVKEGIIASNFTYNLGKRFPVILNVNGTKVAFYRSSEGSGGKKKGSWTPMFGFGESKGNPWLIKGDIDTQVNLSYNNSLIKQYEDLLNKTLNWDHSLDKGKVKDHPYFKDLKVTSSKEDFNKELYGVGNLGIVNNESDVSGFIKSKLKSIQPAQQASGVEAKKSDIERRRQEELKIPTEEEAKNITYNGTPLKDTKYGKIARFKEQLDVMYNNNPEYFTKEGLEIADKFVNGIINKEQINAKYDAELDALEPTKQTSKVELTSPKNVFTVNPKQSADKKAKAKAKISTKYIGFADGINGSSTALYAEQAGNVANTGDYNSNDVVFVSVPGKRGNAEVVKSQQDKTIKEAIKAVEAGATIITDNKSYIDSSSYNTGEKRLYNNMEAKGYNYSEITVDGQTLGTWSKSVKQTPQSSDTKVRKDEKDSVPSQPDNKSYTNKRRVMGGKKRPSRKINKQTDSTVKPKDEDGKLDQDCPF